MTEVNWEVRSGDEVEKIAAALILLDNPSGNRITPSRGDKGIDIRVDTPHGADIYQVKRYARPLTAKQIGEVERSWQTFVRDILVNVDVRSWTLVCPWDPTNERRDWLRRLGDETGLVPHWLGRTQLNVKAAQRPSVVDYFVGDGAEDIKRLMSQAFGAAAKLTAKEISEGGHNVLDAATSSALDLQAQVTERSKALVASLNEIDPFWKYDFAIREGRLEVGGILPVDGATTNQWTAYRQLDENYYRVIRLSPACVASQWLRPIQFTLQLDASDAVVQQFMLYGTPIEDVVASVIQSEGPAGSTPPEGDGLFSVWHAPVFDKDTPGVELRVLGKSGDLLARLDLVDLSYSHGLGSDPGMRLVGADQAGMIRIEALLRAEPQEVMNLKIADPVGLPPRDVLPAAEFMAKVRAGHRVELALRDGVSLAGDGWVMSDETAHDSWVELTDLCSALIRIQQRTTDRIVVPEVTQENVRSVRDVLDLLDGQQVRGVWREFDVHLSKMSGKEPWRDQVFRFTRDQFAVVRVGEQLIRTDIKLRYDFLSAIFVAADNATGGSLRFRPAANTVVLYRMVDQDEDWKSGRYLIGLSPAER